MADRVQLTPEQRDANKKAKSEFATIEEAKASPPGSSGWSLVKVTRPDGRVFWSWNDNPANAVRDAALRDGYVGELAEPKARAPRTPRTFTTDELRAELLRREQEEQARLAESAPVEVAPKAAKGRKSK